jgi:cytochrome P450
MTSQATIKEAMRMHPGVGFPLERYVPPEGCTLNGTFLPGGSIVSMSAPVLHADITVYGKDALTFRPERWLEATPEQLKIMDRSFLSVSLVTPCSSIQVSSGRTDDRQFGYGARTCIGKNISLLEMGKFIPQIFRQFDVLWARSSEEEWKLHAAWFWKQDGIDVTFRSRDKCEA